MCRQTLGTGWAEQGDSEAWPAGRSGHFWAKPQVPAHALSTAERARETGCILHPQAALRVDTQGSW